jgi:hypothetical protein
VVVALVALEGAPAAGLALGEAGAVGHAVDHGGGPDGREVLGAVAVGVVDAADAEEGLVRVGDVEDGVVGGGAGG